MSLWSSLPLTGGRIIGLGLASALKHTYTLQHNPIAAKWCLLARFTTYCDPRESSFRNEDSHASLIPPSFNQFRAWPRFGLKIATISAYILTQCSLQALVQVVIIVYHSSLRHIPVLASVQRCFSEQAHGTGSVARLYSK